MPASALTSRNASNAKEESVYPDASSNDDNEKEHKIERTQGARFKNLMLAVVMLLGLLGLLELSTKAPTHNHGHDPNLFQKPAVVQPQAMTPPEPQPISELIIRHVEELDTKVRNHKNKTGSMMEIGPSSAGEVRQNDVRNLQLPVDASTPKHSQNTLPLSSLAVANTRNDTKQVSTRKPRMYLHIGPAKTGTSFLQCALSKQVAYESLLADNIQYVGRCLCKEKNYPNPDCFYLNNGEVFGKDGQLKGNLMKVLKKIKKAGRDGLMVNEFLAPMGPSTIRKLVEELKRDGWEVHAMLWYRRLFEWLPSYFGQMQNFGSLFKAWPEKGSVGRPRLDFDMYTRKERSQKLPQNFYNYRRLVTAMEDKGMHPAEFYRQLWLPYSHTFTVLNYHASPFEHNTTVGDPLLVNLFCGGVLEGTNQTCALARANALPSQNRNKRFDAEFDKVATHAREVGLLGKTQLSRDKVGGAIAKYQRGNTITWPLRCMSESSMGALYNYSLQGENFFFPNIPEEFHRQAFQAYRDKQAYCAVDVDAVVKDPVWQGFLQTL